jgi:hypothetical protein
MKRMGWHRVEEVARYGGLRDPLTCVVEEMWEEAGRILRERRGQGGAVGSQERVRMGVSRPPVPAAWFSNNVCSSKVAKTLPSWLAVSTLSSLFLLLEKNW